MKNVFEHHGLGHLSASTINQWIQQPALCLLKIGGFSDGEAGAAAWRGSGVDRAVTKPVGRQVSGLLQTASRQASIYSLGTGGREPWIDYVTTKEVRAYKVERVDYWLRQVELATKSLERVLSHSDDIIECCQLVYPDLDHWMWGDTMKRIAADIWQMENHDEMS